MTRPLRAIQQIQLGTVCTTNARARATLGQMVAAGYEGMELNGFMTRPVSLPVRAMTRLGGMPIGRGGRLDWSALIAESGLTAVGFHEDLGIIEREPDAVARRAAAFGTRTIVVPGMYRFDYADASAVRALAARLEIAGRRLREAGFRLLYHNHNAELARTASGSTAFELLIDGTDPDAVGFEFDAFWPASAGADPVALLRRLGDRVKLVHLTDRGCRAKGPRLTPIVKADSVELGAGNLPLEGILRAATDNGVEAVIVETHRNWVGGDPIESARVSAAWLTRHLEEITR